MNLEQETQRVSGCLAQRRVPDDIARQMHIEQYATRSMMEPSWDRQREDAIRDLARRTGVSENDLNQHNWAGHNLIDALLNAGKKDLAIQIAREPSRFREQHPDLLTKWTAWRFIEDPRLRKHVEINKEISGEIKTIKKDRETWKKAFEDELRMLDLNSDAK